MLFIKSPVSKLMVSHNLSTTAFRLLNMMLPNPICLICFQICSMGFISGVYGGICVITIFSGIFSLFDLCHTAPSHTKIKMSLQKYSDSSFKKTFMFSVLQFGKTKKKAFSRKRFYWTKGIPVLSYMMAGNTRSNIIITPAVFRFINSSKTCFILKHYSYPLIFMFWFYFLYQIGNFFFDISISLSSAFLGCLLLGITFLKPCLFST